MKIKNEQKLKNCIFQMKKAKFIVLNKLKPLGMPDCLTLNLRATEQHKLFYFCKTGEKKHQPYIWNFVFDFFNKSKLLSFRMIYVALKHT
jgi:hypothetical protein